MAAKKVEAVVTTVMGGLATRLEAISRRAIALDGIGQSPNRMNEDLLVVAAVSRDIVRELRDAAAVLRAGADALDYLAKTPGAGDPAAPVAPAAEPATDRTALDGKAGGE